MKRCSRFQEEHGTRLIIAENVVAGSIHRLCSTVFKNEYDIRVIHTATEDSGYGCVKRYRGWRHVSMGSLSDVHVRIVVGVGMLC